MNNRIVVLVPYYNVAAYLPACYDCLTTQQYDNYKLYFLDDASSDGSSDAIGKHEKAVVVRQRTRSFALKNLGDVLSSGLFNDDDIMVFVDGDDLLANDQVFAKVNALYNRTGCLLTYGQYVCDNGAPGHCIPYTSDEFGSMRNHDFRVSHLRTFRYALYRQFLEQDNSLQCYKDNNGLFYNMAYDVALMYPLMEIAGFEKVFFNAEVLYVYRLHALNDHNIDRQRQRNIEMQIRSKKPFKRVF